MDNTIRLHQTIAAVCPIIGIAVVGQSVTISFDPAATTVQQAAAAMTVDTFDWTAGAAAVWAAQQAKAIASAHIDNGALQSGVALERLVRALALVVLDEVNILRAAVTPVALSPRTTTQLVNAIKTKIAATAE